MTVAYKHGDDVTRMRQLSVRYPIRASAARGRASSTYAAPPSRWPRRRLVARLHGLHLVQAQLEPEVGAIGVLTTLSSAQVSPEDVLRRHEVPVLGAGDLALR